LAHNYIRKGELHLVPGSDPASKFGGRFE